MQQINLYTDEFMPKKHYFSARTTLVSCLLLVGLLLALHIVFSKNTKTLENSIAQLAKVDTSKKQTLTTIKKKMQSIKTESLDETLALLNLDLEEKKKLKTVIQFESLSSQYGYSDALAALSSNLLQGIQVEQFTFHNGLKLVELKGSAKEPKTVTRFVEALQNDSVFKESRFGLLNINNAGSNASKIARYKVGYGVAMGETR